MDKLSNQLKPMFEFYEKNPAKPDNQFLELCSFTNYIPTILGKDDSAEHEIFPNLLAMVFTNPKMLRALTDNSLSAEEQQKTLIEELFKKFRRGKTVYSNINQNWCN